MSFLFLRGLALVVRRVREFFLTALSLFWT